MSRPAPLLGVVLAGGSSRRLGRDKAGERIGAERLIDRAVGALAEVCNEVLVVSSRPDTPSGPWVRVPDLRRSCGPLGGIETALDAALSRGCEAVFVLACDLPLVDGEVVAAVVDALGSASAAAPSRDGDPDLEPLCAVYRSSSFGVARRLLDEGVREAHALFTAVEGVHVEIGGHRFLNVNTEDDLGRASSALDSGEVS